VALPGVPFDEKQGVIPNQGGRVLDQPGGAPVPGLYVAGWIKRGPSGVIGTNKPCAKESVQLMLEDLRERAEAAREVAHVLEVLVRKGIRSISFADWRQIDQHKGAVRGEPSYQAHQCRRNAVYLEAGRSAGQILKI
jgi:ferredoxin--NADP+ reductase